MSLKLERLLRLLWEEWDPIGLNDNQNIADEYDSYAFELWGKLRGGATIEDVESYLNWAETDHMGLSQGSGRNRGIAEKAFAIFHPGPNATTAWLAIRLNPNELSFLRSSDTVPDALKRELEHVAPHRMVALLEAEAADDLRERLLGKLDVSGFDENYALTPDGQIMDGLTDKLFNALQAANPR